MIITTEGTKKTYQYSNGTKLEIDTNLSKLTVPYHYTLTKENNEIVKDYTWHPYLDRIVYHTDTQNKVVYFKSRYAEWKNQKEITFNENIVGNFRILSFKDNDDVVWNYVSDEIKFENAAVAE